MDRKSAGLEAFTLTCQFFSGKVYFKNMKFYIICHCFHFATKTEIPGCFANLADLAHSLANFAILGDGPQAEQRDFVAGAEFR